MDIEYVDTVPPHSDRKNTRWASLYEEIRRAPEGATLRTDLKDMGTIKTAYQSVRNAAAKGFLPKVTIHQRGTVLYIVRGRGE